MSKVEPMRVETMRTLISNRQNGVTVAIGDNLQMSLILAWIHAEARARFYKHYEDFTFEQQLAAVKKEVGWPED